MPTLVTCATSFVSRAFVRALRAEGEDVHVLIRDGSKASSFSREKVFVGDVFDPSCVAAALKDADTVVHVPARVYPSGDEDHQLAMHRRAHVESTRIVLDQAAALGIGRFLLVSSAHATGRGTSSARCETSPGVPETPYARAKLEAEELALSYVDRRIMEVVAVRPPGIYGPGDKGVVSSLRRAAQLNLWLPVEGIQALHSLVSVDNLARAGTTLLRMAGHGKVQSRAYIVKDPVDYSPADLYATVCRTLGKRAMLFRAPTQLLRTLATVGDLCQSLPKVRALAMFRHLSTPQRYCGHLFNESAPDFRFVGIDETLSMPFGFGTA